MHLDAPSHRQSSGFLWVNWWYRTSSSHCPGPRPLRCIMNSSKTGFETYALRRHGATSSTALKHQRFYTTHGSFPPSRAVSSIGSAPPDLSAQGPSEPLLSRPGCQNRHPSGPYHSLHLHGMETALPLTEPSISISFSGRTRHWTLSPEIRIVRTRRDVLTSASSPMAS